MHIKVYTDPPHISYHTLGNSQLTYITFENIKKENPEQPNSIVNDLCSVLITEWGHLEIKDWSSLLELQGQGWAGFHEPCHPSPEWTCIFMSSCKLQALGGSLIYCSPQRK
jgi:hypothetical protein